MSEIQCPNCGGYKTTIQRQRGWGLLMLVIGLMLIVVGYIALQTWFPADNFWRDFVVQQTLSYPDDVWDFLWYAMAFAVIASLGLVLLGVGGWLMSTSRLECEVCGYKRWRE